MNSVSLDKVKDQTHNLFDTDLKRMKLIHCKSRYTRPLKENDKQLVANHPTSKATKKRLLLNPQKESSFKRRRSEESDIDLDKAANTISEVSGWRVVLEKWNVVTEDLSLKYSYIKSQKRIAA
jgi:hypothetical protein